MNMYMNNYRLSVIRSDNVDRIHMSKPRTPALTHRGSPHRYFILGDIRTGKEAEDAEGCQMWELDMGFNQLSCQVGVEPSRTSA
jgi:hypothetical protein